MPVRNEKPLVQHYWPKSSVNASFDPMWYCRTSKGWRRVNSDRQDLVLPYAGFTGQGYIVKTPLYPTAEVYGIGVATSDWLDKFLQNTWGAPFASAINKSWDKLMEQTKGDTSALAVNAAEGREAFEMVAKRVTGLYRSYKKLREGDFRGFLRELRVEPKRKHRSRVRSAAHEASGLWLEYWFGWSPTVQDLYSASLALSSNPVLSRVREIASSKMTLPTTGKGSGSGRSRWNVTTSGKCFVKQGATFELANANLFLANRLGLVNPASVAWEVIPFSFVIDWFTKFGNFIEGYTDLAGLSVYDAFATSRITLSGQVSTWSTRDRPGTELIIGLRQDGHIRQVGLVRPIPVTPKLVNFGGSKTRAATAVSLLTSIFIGK